MNLYKYHKGDLKHKEHQLLVVPELAFNHAMKTREPFPAGEKAIATSPLYAFQYATKVLKDRFPAGEKAIASDPMYAYMYARNVLKARFPAGEKVMASDPEYAQGYAQLYNKEFGTNL